MKLNLKRDVTILGYSGAYLALIFENLHAAGFSGTAHIIINEKEKRAPAPFEAGINFREIFYTDANPENLNAFIFCSNRPSTKLFLFDLYEKLWQIKREDFVALVHPSSVVASTVTTSPGLQLEALSVISSYAVLGFGVNISRNCSIGHHNVIGDFCSVYLGSNTAGHVEIGDRTVIGPGTTVFSKVKIGSNTVIGGGSVVTKDIPSGVLAYGNPCKVIRNI